MMNNIQRTCSLRGVILISLLVILATLLYSMVSVDQSFTIANPYKILWNGVTNSSDPGGNECPTIKTKDETRTILWWNTIFGAKGGFFRIGRGNSLKDLAKRCKRKCHFTDDRAFVNKSHAIIFHAWASDLRAEKVLVNGSDTLIPVDAPPCRDPNQVYVYMSTESSIRMRTNMTAYRYFFNWTMSYRLDSDFPITYGRFHNNSPKEIQAYGSGPDLKSYSNKTKVAAWIVSNCQEGGTKGERKRIADELSKYVPVDIYGRCGNNTCPKGANCYKELGKTYKFYLSFENSLCRDYVTEKFFNAIEANMVPVVYGKANYGQQFAPGSFINVDSFASAKALADYLMYLDKNPEEYAKYFRWKKYYKEVQSFRVTELFCGICERLHKEFGVTRQILDIVDWMYRSNSDSPACNDAISDF